MARGETIIGAKAIASGIRAGQKYINKYRPLIIVFKGQMAFWDEFYGSNDAAGALNNAIEIGIERSDSTSTRHLKRSALLGIFDAAQRKFGYVSVIDDESSERVTYFYMQSQAARLFRAGLIPDPSRNYAHESLMRFAGSLPPHIFPTIPITFPAPRNRFLDRWLRRRGRPADSSPTPTA